MSVVTGQELGQRLCVALGLDPDTVKRITIVCDADDIATVTVVFCVGDSQRIVETLKTYELVGA